MIRNIFTAICWFLIGICIFSIGIVIIWGGIYLFSIGDFHVAVHDIRRPAGFLILFSIILLFLKNINIKMVLNILENMCTKKFVFGLLGIFTLLFIWLKISNHITFGTGYDLAIFDHAIFNTLKGNFMYTSLLERSFFSEHFSPILLLIVPIYLLYASPIVLLILLALVTVLSGYFVYKLAKLEIKNNLIPILILISYLGNKSLMGGFLFDFHEASLEPLFILGAFYFFRIRKYIYYWIFIILAVMCKEDVSLYIFVFGLYIIIFERNIKVGLYTCVLSLFTAFLAFKVVLPLSHPEKIAVSHFLFRWREYGNTYKEVVFNLIKNPGLLLSKLLSKPSLALFYPLLFLPLLSPSKVLLTIPPLLLSLTSNFPPQANLYSQYSASIIPFLWIACIYGLKKIRHQSLLITIAFLIFILNFGHYKYFNIVSKHVSLGHKIIKMIPDKAPMSTQCWFIPHISRRKDIWLFPKIKNAEYILVDMVRYYGNFPNKRGFYRELKKYLYSNRWEILVDEDGYKLLKKLIPVPG